MLKLKIKNSNSNDDVASQIVSWGHWFALFNSFIVIIIGSRYFIVGDWPSTLFGRVYAIISCIGHFTFLTFMLYLILLFPLSFFTRSPKWYRIFSILVATTAITLLLIDIEIFNRFRMHLSFSIWQILTSPHDNILNVEWQKIFIFMPFILLVEIILSVWSWRKLRSLYKRRRYSRPVVLLFIVCFLSSHFIHIWADANFYRPITMQRSSLPLSYPLTAKHFLARYGFLTADEYKSRIKQEGNPFAIAIEYPLGKINYQPAKESYNILMIVVDNWYGDLDLITMPNLYQFGQEHLQFNNHFSSSNKSYLGEFSLFYGLDPNYYNSILTSRKPSVLLDTLSRQHYNLGLFSTNGFADSLYKNALLSNFSIPESKEHSIKATTNHWLDWFKEQQKIQLELSTYTPWFSIVQYNSNEISMSSEIANNYMPQIDQSFAKIIQALAKSDQLNKTIVIFTAANRINSIKNSQLNRNQFNVPLVIAWPNKEHALVMKPTSHVDVMQTLMQDGLNVKSAAKIYSQGDNLFNKMDRDWLIAGDESEIAALYSDKTIVIDNKGHYEIYDLKNQLSDEKIGLSIFLKLMSENRRFMVNH